MHKSEKKRCFSSATFSQLKMKSQIFAWLGGDFLAWWLFLCLASLFPGLAGFHPMRKNGNLKNQFHSIIRVHLVSEVLALGNTTRCSKI